VASGQQKYQTGATGMNFACLLLMKNIWQYFSCESKNPDPLVTMQIEGCRQRGKDVQSHLSLKAFLTINKLDVKPEIDKDVGR